MKVLVLMIPAILLLNSLDTSALAMARGSNVCEPFQARFCGGLLELGQDKLVSCLKEHWDDLSQDCRDVLVEKK